MDEVKILVVDDEETVRLSCIRSLASEGCRVAAAWNGEEALHAMERDAADVVLLDLRMPGMDGLAVLGAIKQRWPECEVVVFTGYPSIETAKQAVRLGACDYLAKPLGPGQIIHAAHGALLQKKWRLRTDGGSSAGGKPPC